MRTHSHVHSQLSAAAPKSRAFVPFAYLCVHGVFMERQWSGHAPRETSAGLRGRLAPVRITIRRFHPEIPAQSSQIDGRGEI